MPKRMSDEEILAILQPSIDAARSHRQEISLRDQESYDLYRFQPLGNERDGWSQVVDSVAWNNVEWRKASLSAVFEGDFFNLTSDNEERAEKFKKLIRQKHFIAQRGKRLNKEFIHDALINVTGGIFKICHVDEYDLVTERYKRMSEEQFAALSSDPNVVVTKYEEVEQIAEQSPGEFLLGLPPRVLFRGVENVKALRKKTTYRGPKVYVLPSWELYYTPGYPDIEKCPFVAHRVKRTLADIRKRERAGEYKAGSYDACKEHIDNRQDSGDEVFDQEARAAVDDLSYHESDSSLHTDELTYDANEVWIWECYFRADIDQDGFLEPCICTICEDVVLKAPVENPYGRAPIVIGAPFREPHKMEQLPLPLQLDHEQKEQTNLRRQIVDAGAESTYSTTLCANAQVLQAWQDRSPGDGILASRLDGDVKQVQAPSISQFPLRAYEMGRDNIARKTGLSEFNQGGDQSAMGKTATGIQLVLGATQTRDRYIADQLALAFEELIRWYIFILQKWPDENEQVQVAGSTIQITPEDLKAEYSISVNIGVGPQDKALVASHLNELVAFGAQVGVPMGIMRPDHLVKAKRRALKLLDVPGYRELLPSDEELAKMMQNGGQPNPQMQQMQQAIQQLQQQLQESNRKLNDKSAEIAIKARDVDGNLELQGKKIAGELALKREEVTGKLQVAQFEAGMKAQAERERLAMQGENNGEAGKTD